MMWFEYWRGLEIISALSPMETIQYSHTDEDVDGLMKLFERNWKNRDWDEYVFGLLIIFNPPPQTPPQQILF